MELFNILLLPITDTFINIDVAFHKTKIDDTQRYLSTVSTIRSRYTASLSAGIDTVNVKPNIDTRCGLSIYTSRL